MAYRLLWVGIEADAPADVHVQHVRATLLEPEDLALVISHTGLAYARRFPDPLPHIPLLAPASALSVLSRLDDLFAVPSLPQMARTIAVSFELGPLSLDGVPAAIAGAVQLASFPVAHAVPSAALRFTAQEETVTFSSDTGACDALIAAARDARLFLCEATYLAASPAELSRHGHLTPELAGAAASRAGTRQLVLTHLARADDAAAAIAAAGRHFGAAPVTVATPGTTISTAAPRTPGELPYPHAMPR